VVLVTPGLPLDLSWPHYYLNCLWIVYLFCAARFRRSDGSATIYLPVLKVVCLD
jgi:hypothetical protein